MILHGCQLGREYKLSISELIHVYPKMDILYSDKGVIVFSGYSSEEILSLANNLGGTIKIFELEMKMQESDIIDSILTAGENYEGKFKYGLNLFGEKGKTLDYFLKQTKNNFKNNKISARYFNQDTNKNLSSAQIIGHKILKKGFDYNIVNIGGIYYFGKTLWVQDIDSYSERDFGKKTDMNVGMLPPKLSQMMINISGGKKIYDPFVGLGTILIESVYMGNKEVYGSDLNDKTLQITKNNLKSLNSKFDFQYSLENLNAKFISESNYLIHADAIVTEGYLGEVMTQNNISIERIEKQKSSLFKIYTAFFTQLKEAGFKGNIVICFPFWEMKGKYVYFQEIYTLLNKLCDIQPLFPDSYENMTTKSGSLLYKRRKQLVGREIFKLTIK